MSQILLQISNNASLATIMKIHISYKLLLSLVVVYVFFGSLIYLTATGVVEAYPLSLLFLLPFLILPYLSHESSENKGFL